MTSCILTPRTAPGALRAYLADLFSANVLGGAPIIPESVEDFVVNNDYALAEEYRSLADQLMRELDDTQCCDATLYARAAQYGVFPSPGKYATGYVKLTGTPGAPVPRNLSVVLGQGTYERAPYAMSADQIEADGTAVVMLRAAAPGAAFNDTSGSSAANLLQNLDGVDSQVTILGAGFCNGEDADTPETFRARYLRRKRFKPDGSWKWMIEAAEDFGCVTRISRRTSGACATGRIEAFAMMDGVFDGGLPPDSVNRDLTKWMFGSPNGMGLGKAAMNVFGRFFTAQAASVNLSISGLGCLSSAQRAQLQAQIGALFRTLCPEQTLCKRLIEALIVTLAGAICETTVTFSPVTAGVTINSLGDAVPIADHRVVLDQLTLSP